MTLQIWHTCILGVSHIHFCRSSQCQVGRGALLQSYFQVSPEMFDRVQIRDLDGPLKDIQTCPEDTPAFSWLCVRVVVLLEGEPLPESEVLVHSGAGFHQGSLCTFLLSSFPRSWLVSQSLLLKNISISLCITVGMVTVFLETWCLAFRPKSSILFSSEQRILFLMVWESFRCLLATPSGLSCAFLLRSSFRLATLP